MRLLLFFIILISITGFNNKPVLQNKLSAPADEVMEKLLDKLNAIEKISYDYNRSINYFSENYHGEISGKVFLDFASTDTIIGFKYQWESEQNKMIFNGSESFYLNKKEKTLKVTNRPKLGDFSSLSFFTNSIVTLKKVLPTIIADKEILKANSDTVIDNRNFYLITFVLPNKTLNNLGTFTAVTQKRDFIYKVIVDKENYLPQQIIQTNNVEPKDFMLTSFSNFKINSNIPSEQSWHYSTYAKEYRPSSEKVVSLIKPNTTAPNWQLPFYESNNLLKLDELKGSVVLLEFWIKNCGYCIAAVPKINSIIEKYKNNKFQVVGINSHDTKEVINSFYQKNKPNFKTVYDKGKITNDYGVDAFPTVVLLDKKGIVLYSGNFDYQTTEALIKTALQ